MIRSLTPEQKTELIEKLADLEHKQWGHWMHYLLSKVTPEIRELLYEDITRWERQMMIHYSNLSEKEKESDRVWARKVPKILKELNLEIVSK